MLLDELEHLGLLGIVGDQGDERGHGPHGRPHTQQNALGHRIDTTLSPVRPPRPRRAPYRPSRTGGYHRTDAHTPLAPVCSTSLHGARTRRRAPFRFQPTGAASAAPVAISSDRTNRSAAATAVKATPAITQNARWMPSVSASGGETPVFTSVSTRVNRIVEATATPIAPPICCDVLIRPDAETGLVRLDAGQRGDGDGDERHRDADADEDVAEQQVGREARVDRQLGVHDRAGAEQREPDGHHRLRRRSSWSAPARRRPRSRPSRRWRGTSTPAFSAEKPSTCWTNSVSRKKFENSAAPSRNPTTFAAETVWCAEERQPDERRADARLDHDERDQQRRRRPRRARSCGSMVQPSDGAFEIV